MLPIVSSYYKHNKLNQKCETCCMTKENNVLENQVKISKYHDWYAQNGYKSEVWSYKFSLSVPTWFFRSFKILDYLKTADYLWLLTTFSDDKMRQKKSEHILCSGSIQCNASYHYTVQLVQKCHIFRCHVGLNEWILTLTLQLGIPCSANSVSRSFFVALQ